MRIGFIAVQGIDKGEVLARLVEAECDAEVRKWGTGAVGVSSDGWVIVVKPDPQFPSPERLAVASDRATAVGYAGDTVVMCTDAAGYRDGQEIWWIEHNAEEGDVNDLRTRGQLPAGFEAIVAATRKKQAESEHPDVDYMFDVTEEVVDSICGFHLERETTIEFRALQSREPPRKPGLLARLFGAS